MPSYTRSSSFIDNFGPSGTTIALGGAVGAAASVFVALFSDAYNDGGVPMTVTDNQSNTYTLARTWLNGSANNSGLFYCHNITNAPTELVINWTGGGNRYIESAFLEGTGFVNAGPSYSDHLREVNVETTSITLDTLAAGEALIGFMLSQARDVTPTSGISRYPSTGSSRVWLFDDDAGAAGAKTIGASWTSQGVTTIPFVAASFGPSGGSGISLAWIRA